MTSSQIKKEMINICLLFVTNLQSNWLFSYYHYPSSLHESDHWWVRFDIKQLGPRVVVAQCIQIFLFNQLCKNLFYNYVILLEIPM